MLTLCDREVNQAKYLRFLPSLLLAMLLRPHCALHNSPFKMGLQTEEIERDANAIANAGIVSCGGNGLEANNL